MIIVLVLSGAQDLELPSLGYENKITTEADLGNSKLYEAPKEVLEKVTNMTANQEFDYVVVRSAMGGAGLDKVRAIDESMISHTIVVWNTLFDDDDKKPYQDLGVMNFSTTFGIVPFLEDLIEKEMRCEGEVVYNVAEL